jgi:hypothetical protein
MPDRDNQVVAGEPSLGTGHFKKRDGTDRTVINAAAGSAAWTEVDCSALVSPGARAVKLHVIIACAGAASGVQTVLCYVFSDENTSTPTGGWVEFADSYPGIAIQFPGIATVGGIWTADKDIEVPLNSALKFYFYRTVNTSTASPMITAYIVEEIL